MKTNPSDTSPLGSLKDSDVSGKIDEVFRSVIKDQAMSTKSAQPSGTSGAEEIALEDAAELDIGLVVQEVTSSGLPIDEGLDLAVDSGEELDIGELDEGFDADSASEDHYGDLSLEGADASDSETPPDEVDPDERTVVKSLAPSGPAADSSDGSSNELTMGAFGLSGTELGDDGDSVDLGEGGEVGDLGAQSDTEEEIGLDLGPDGPPSADLTLGGLSLSDDLSDDAKKKLEEIDAIMDLDASQVNLSPHAELLDQGLESESSEVPPIDLDEELVSSDLDLDSLNFETAPAPGPDPVADIEEEAPVPPPKLPRKKAAEPRLETRDRSLGEDLRDLSGAYSGEMERMQATISNLRTDRDELLTKIAKLEEEKVLEKRLGLTLRAELDERKIELTIIRKKLNEEIGDLKDRLKLYDEKRLILEERNRVLLVELDKAAQKTKIDVKKIQLRERELEQKLELLKSDAETQIRNRDLKLLELKRKIDSMEFDMESISQQEKRSVESRFELEDKLEKAIKTLRSAITVLEEDTDRTGVLNALKKNIDM